MKKFIYDLNMIIEIITPDIEIYKGEVKLVQLQGIDGSFELLDNHAPMISILKEGKVRVIDIKDGEKFFDINGGVLEVQKNKVLVLAE